MKYLINLVVFMSILFTGCVNSNIVIDETKHQNNTRVIDEIDTINKNQIGKPFLNIGQAAGIGSIATQGNYIVSAGADHSIKLWDIKSKKLIKTFKGHTQQITSVAIQNDYIVSGSLDKTVKLWTIKDGKLLKTFKGHTNWVVSVAIQGDYIISGATGKNGTIKIWSIKQKKLLKTLRHSISGVQSIFIYKNYIVSGGNDKTVKLWDLYSGKLFKTFKGHKKSVSSVAIYENYIVSGSYDKTVKLWDANSGKLLKTFNGHNDKVQCVAIDKNYIVSGSYDKTVKLWGIKSKKLIHTFNRYNHYIGAVAIQGDCIVSADSGGIIKLWSIKNSQLIATFGNRSRIINSIAFYKNYMVSGSYDKTVKLWDINSGKLLKTFKGHKKKISSVSIQGDYIVSGSDDDTVKLWDVNKGKLLKTFNEDREIVEVAIQGDYMILSDWSGKIELWSITDKKLLKSFDTKTVSIAIYDNYIASSDWSGEIKLWSINKRKLLKTFKCYNSKISSLAIYKNYIVASAQVLGVGNVIKLLDINSGEVLQTFHGHSDTIISVDINDNYLISGSFDGTVRLWGIKNKKLSKKLNIGIKVAFVKMYHDKIYVGCSDGTIRIYDINKGYLAQIVAFEDGEWVSITKDGYFDASKNGAKYLNILTSSTDVAGIDQYYDKFYRPDLVKLTLAGKEIKTNLTIASVKPAPDVQIIKTVSKTDKKMIDVTLKITPKSGGIGDIKLYLNGSSVKVDKTRGLKLKQKYGAIYKTYTIKLVNGKNIIKAIVYNQDNTMNSMEVFHTVVAKFETASKPKLYAIVIGIDKYRNSKLNLKYAVNDAKLFAKTLKKVTKGLFDKADIKLLTSKKETSKDNILNTIKSYQNLNPNDLFVFYVASHGTVDDGEYFLITSSVGSTSKRKLKQSAIMQDELKTLISNIPTTKKMIIFDTRNSGQMGDILQVALQTRGMSEDVAMKVLSRAVGSTIISASTSTQEALEGYKGHGLFTYVLSDGLKGKADINKDGFIKTRELADYVDDTVPELADKVFGREQFPTISPTGQAFPIGRVR